MKRAVSFVAILGVSLLLVACSGSKKVEGNGKITTESRSVADFDELDVNGDFVITLNTNESPSAIQVKTDENLLPYILTENAKTADHVLLIATKPDISIKPTGPVELIVDTNLIKAVRLNGKTLFNASTLRGESLNLSINGSGTSVLKGKLKSLKIDIHGSASVSATNLTAENVDVRILGAAEVGVNTSKKLNVYIKGAGQVTFIGEPPIVNQEVYDGGKVVKGIE